MDNAHITPHEAQKKVAKLDLELYAAKGQTQRIKVLRENFKKKMMVTLTTKVRPRILMHFKLKVLNCTRWQCSECKRYYSTRKCLQTHKKLCGKDQALYGYLETGRHNYICMVCGKEVSTKCVKTNMTVNHHMLEHNNGELKPFGLAARKK